MRRLVPIALLALCACPAKPAPTVATLQGDGFTVRAAANPFSLTVTGIDGTVKLSTASGPRFTFDEHTYEAQIIPGWDGYKSKERPWLEFTTGTLESSDATHAVFTFSSDDVTARVEISLEGKHVRYRQSVQSTTRRFNKSSLLFTQLGDDHFFGMGQRTASVDHKGLSLYSWPEEGGLGGGENVARAANNPFPNGPSMTYFPVPLFHTTHGASVLVDTTFRSEVDFDAFRVAVDDTSLPLVLFIGSPLEVLDDYTALTGRPPLPTDWAFGPRRRVNRESFIGGVAEWQLMRDRGLPLTTVDDAMHALPSYSQKGDEATYATWTALLHANGFKVMDYNNPYVSASAPNSAPDYNVGADAGFFEGAPDGGPATTFFLSGGAQTISAIDLTNPDAAAWFQTLLGRSRALGYDGWMHDFGEYVARDSHFFDGRRGDEMHNAFPVLSAKAGYEAAHEGGVLTGHIFTRSGYTGSQQWVLETWGGDPEASFDETEGLPALLRGGLNLGMVGVPYWSSDMGGYKCITDAPHDKEMLVRWYEMGALSPMMHDEDACSNPLGGSKTKARLWDDQETQDIWRTAAGLHTRLAPYFRGLAREAQAHGTPITRHPFLKFPTEPGTWSVEDSFFIGDGLYGAPVVRRGDFRHDVWIPPGRYVEWTDRTVLQGPRVYEQIVPLGRIPLYLAENQLVPLLDAQVQSLAPASVPNVPNEAAFAGVLDVIAVVGPGGSAHFTLADGTQLGVEHLATDQGNPNGLAAITDFANCTACGGVDQSGSVRRVRLASTGNSQLSDISVTVSGGPGRRIRWEILILDP